MLTVNTLNSEALYRVTVYQLTDNLPFGIIKRQEVGDDLLTSAAGKYMKEVERWQHKLGCIPNTVLISFSILCIIASIWLIKHM